MSEKETEQKSDGKGLFIIMAGRSPNTKPESGSPYFPESPSATRPTALKLKCRI